MLLQSRYLILGAAIAMCTGAARYLRDLKVMFGDDLSLVLAAYNAGEKAVVRYGRRVPPYRETVAYVPKVLRYYRRFRAAPPAALDG